MVAGGRWNPIGVAMLYTARHLSLACIEVLVHLDKGQFPRDYVWSRSELRDVPQLSEIYRLNDVVSCQAAGHSWLTFAGTCCAGAFRTDPGRVQRPAES